MVEKREKGRSNQRFIEGSIWPLCCNILCSLNS